jgi:hypothetical protein
VTLSARALAIPAAAAAVSTISFVRISLFMTLSFAAGLT